MAMMWNMRIQLLVESVPDKNELEKLGISLPEKLKH